MSELWSLQEQLRKERTRAEQISDDLNSEQMTLTLNVYRGQITEPGEVQTQTMSIMDRMKRNENYLRCLNDAYSKLLEAENYSPK